MESEIRHDLNNILSTIITYADLLMQDLKPESAEHKFAQAIFQSGVQAMECVNQKPVNFEQPEFLIDVAIRSQKKLLVVDDQPDILATMQIILEQSGYQAVICTSAGEMEANLQNKEGNGVDLIILDESMPGEQGHEIAARLDRDYPGLPVLLVTGHSKNEILPLTDGISAIRGIVEKSVMLSELVGTADRILL